MAAMKLGESMKLNENVAKAMKSMASCRNVKYLFNNNQ
jgi:hypothetical protein